MSALINPWQRFIIIDEPIIGQNLIIGNEQVRSLRCAGTLTGLKMNFCDFEHSKILMIFDI